MRRCGKRLALNSLLEFAHAFFAGDMFASLYILSDQSRRRAAGNININRPAAQTELSLNSLLVAGFDAQNFRPAGGFGQLPVLTHEAPGAERFCAEMVALS